MSRSAEAVLQDNSFHCFSKSEAKAIVAVLKREGFLTADKERRQDGKYDFSDANAFCECGVRLGNHIAEYPHENDATNCQKFRPAPKSPAIDPVVLAYEGNISIDAKLLHSLWCYGTLKPVEGVVYSYGSHQKCLDAVDELFADRAYDIERALAAPTPVSSTQRADCPCSPAPCIFPECTCALPQTVQTSNCRFPACDMINCTCGSTVALQDRA